MILDEVYDRLLDLFRPKAITIPPMDGCLRPNNLLDEAPVVAEVHQPDNAIHLGGELWFSSTNRLLKISLSSDSSKPETVDEFDHDISCLAAGPDKSLAVGLDSGQVFIERSGNRVEFSALGERQLRCPTALEFIDQNQLVVCQGSEQVRPSEMTKDLMQIGRSGSVWLLDLAGNSQQCIASKLGFPFGVAVLHKTREILVSECWRCRVIKVSIDRKDSVQTVLSDLQGYPARLFQTGGEKTMLCVFAPRNRLVEFVLKENEYRQRMTETVEPEHWIAPQIKSGQNFLEPLQQGCVKTMNIHKPWAPSLSYGLLVRLGQNGNPEASFHSRANGKRHGITSGCEVGNSVYVTSKGGDCILKIAPETEA